MSAEEPTVQSTATAGPKQPASHRKRQSSILPTPQYYRWERQCDECGRVFAYLDVHLSKNKLCRAAYDIKALRERLKETNQAASDGGTTHSWEPSSVEESEADEPVENEQQEPESKRPLNATQKTLHQLDKNTDAPNQMLKRRHPPHTTKTTFEESMSTTDQLLAMQRQLREFHDRLNKCEVMTRRAGMFPGSRQEDRLRLPTFSDDDSGFLDASEQSHDSFTSHSLSRNKRKRPSVLHRRRAIDDSEDDDDELEILGENYLLSAQSNTRKVTRQTTPVHKAYIQKTACRHCGARIKYILSHLSKSFRCQVAYDMTQLRQQAENTKRIRQKYYLKHLRNKKKRPEVFEIVEQITPREGRAARMNVHQRGRPRHAVNGLSFVGREIKLDDTEDWKPNLSNHILEHTRLPSNAVHLAPSSPAPWGLFPDPLRVRAPSPATCDVDSDFLECESESSHSEEALEIVATHTLDDNMLRPECHTPASFEPASVSGGGNQGPTSTDLQSITRLKRSSNRVIRLTKAGRGVSDA